VTPQTAEVIARRQVIPIAQPVKQELIQRVKIVDFDMSFWSMVWFMIKWALASIPAFIVLAIIGWMTVGTIVVAILAAAHK